MAKVIKNKSELVRRHFAETAKYMILQSGVEEVSIRKIAVEAGYSPGTIYNHFTSLDEILWFTRSIMISDMGDFLMKENPGEIDSVDDLKKTFRSYLGYFIDNPGIYRFFYFHRLQKKDKTVDSLADSSEFSKQMFYSLAFLVKSGKCTESEIPLYFQTLILSVQGLLTMVVTENDDIKAEAAYGQLDELIDFIMK